MNEGVIYILIIIGIYFLPTIIGVVRGHPSGGGIFALNLFLGITFIGWVGALIWSLSNKHLASLTQTVVMNGNSEDHPTWPAGSADPVVNPNRRLALQPQSVDVQCPMCAETIKIGAKKCRYCGEYFPEALTNGATAAGGNPPTGGPISQNASKNGLTDVVEFYKQDSGGGALTALIILPIILVLVMIFISK